MTLLITEQSNIVKLYKYLKTIQIPLAGIYVNDIK